MSKRITFTDREIWHIIQAIKTIQKEANHLTSYQVAKAGNQALQDIIDKLESVNSGFELQKDGAVTSAL